jgi:choline dehydrogenase-like flavoprotein
LFVPRFRNLDKNTKMSNFLRGYGFECSSGTGRSPGAARFVGFGSEFKKTVRHWYTAPVSMTVRAHMLSRFENFVDIDPNGVVDAWGIPVLKIHIQHSDNERAMATDALETSQEIMKAAGGEVVSISNQMTVPGRIIHELGTARMGNDAKKSVLNGFNQVWDCKNVFVTDGAAFVGAANQNPTITIMALTMRACDYIQDEMKRGNL